MLPASVYPEVLLINTSKCNSLFWYNLCCRNKTKSSLILYILKTFRNIEVGFSVAWDVDGFTQFPGLIGRSGVCVYLPVVYSSQSRGMLDVSYKENIVLNVYVHQLMHLFISPREQ
jgi:hypothetical protein